LHGWNGSFPKFLKGFLDPTGVELLDKLLTYNPKDRITAKEALDHPYFDEYFDNENKKSSQSKLRYRYIWIAADTSFTAISSDTDNTISSNNTAC